MTPSAVRNSFFQILDDTEDQVHLFVKSPGSDMTRHRCCSFKDTVLATISCSMNRTNTELLQFFAPDHEHIPSKSAFSQQRHKFNSLLFPHLLRSVNAAFPFKKTFNGFHLVAVDGTDLNLPSDRSDSLYRIKQARSELCYYQMHINALFDLCENRFLSLLTQPRPQMDESEAFLKLLSDCSMPANTIFIADRGYFSFYTIAQLLEHGRFFLIRAKAPDSSASFLRNLIPDNLESDRLVSLCASRSKKAARSYRADKFLKLRKDRRFDLIPEDDHSSVWFGSFRCTCVKLDNGSCEYLVSNLPMDRFSSSDLKELYWKRWGIETSFRRLKYALSLVFLHSVSRDLIIQEVFAKAILYNLTSLLQAYAQNTRQLKERIKRNGKIYRVSFDDAVPITRSFLQNRLPVGKIKALLLQHLTPIRKTSSPSRKVRSQCVRPLNNRA